MQNGADEFNLILERMTNSLLSDKYLKLYKFSDDSKLISFYTLLE